MVYGPIVDVNITISDVQVSTEGFGTPLFFTAHREEAERVNSFTNAQDVGAFYGTDSAAYRAATKAFGQQPSVNLFKVGRRDGEQRLLATGFTDGDTLGFTITNKLGVPFAASYVVQVADTALDIANGLKASVETSPDALEDCTPIIQGSTLILKTALDGVDWKDAFFTVGSYLGTFTGQDIWYGTEGAAQMYTEITQTDNDFYFISGDDNSKSFALDMAAAVSTDTKIYFVSDSSSENTATIVDPDNSLFGQLAASNYDNTVTFYHQDAGDSTVAASHESADYPEMAWIGANAVYQPGSVTWANIPLVGVSASADPSTGRRLTATQKGNLESRNSNFMEYDAGNSFTRYGQTAGNEWIDTIRGVDWQTADISSNLKALLLGQKGGKITYDNQGIARIREVIASSLQRGVNNQFLSEYTITMPRLTDISSTDKLNRILTGVKFAANLAGAIHEVVVQGTVSEG